MRVLIVDFGSCTVNQWKSDIKPADIAGEAGVAARLDFKYALLPCGLYCIKRFYENKV